MAVRKIAMVVNLRQNKNEAAEHFGKWYPEVDTKTPLDLKGFCAHMTEHGKLADYQMVVLVVQQVVECMKELVLQGQPVKLEGLGTFGPSLESKKGGANSVQAAMDAGLDTLIEGVHMNFTPENTKGEKLTSRALKDECVFDAGYVVESVKQTVDGKVKRYQNKPRFRSSSPPRTAPRMAVAPTLAVTTPEVTTLAATTLAATTTAVAVTPVEAWTKTNDV